MEGRILLTGFEPFGEDKVNPSGDVAKALDGIVIDDFLVISRILPVEWGKAKQQVEDYIEEVQPTVVLSLGLSGGTPVIAVEKAALNYTSEGKDNAGASHPTRFIVEGAADGYFATIPAEAVVEAIKKEGIPARLSLSAGAYLCNYVFYCASRYVKETRKDAKVGFIHIPATPPMVAARTKGGPSMAQELIEQAVKTCIRTIISLLTDCG